MNTQLAIVPLFFLCIFSFAQNSYQKLDQLYENAPLNTDYSSTINMDDTSNISLDDFRYWVASNPDKFNDLKEIEVAYQPKWYWGSYKTVLKKLGFIKPENVTHRIAYFNELQKRSEEEYRRKREAGILGAVLGTATLVWTVKKGMEWLGKASISEVHSPTVSPEPLKPVKNLPPPKQAEKIDCESEELNNYLQITIKEKGDWEEDNSLTFSDYRQKIKFSDGTTGHVYLGSHTKQYFLSKDAAAVYYDSYDSVIRALYLYLKCNKVPPKIGRKK